MSCCAMASRFLLFVGLWQKKFFQIGLVKSPHHHPPLFHTTDSLFMHVLLQHIKHILHETKFQGLDGNICDHYEVTIVIRGRGHGIAEYDLGRV